MPVDDPPTYTLDAGNVYSCNEDAAVISDIVIHVTDVDTDYSNIQVKASSSNESLLSSQDIAIVRDSVDNWQYNLSLNIAEHAYGTTDIKITVSDGSNEYTLIQPAENNSTVVYTVNAQPDAPIANDVEYTVVAGSTNFFIPTYNDLDHDDNDLVDVDLEITSLTIPTGGTASIVYDTMGSYRGVDYIAPEELGTYTFNYTVSDGSLTDTAQVVVNVVENDSIGPYFDAIDDMYLTENDIVAPFDINIGGFNNIASVEVTSNNQSIFTDAVQTASQNVGRNYSINMNLTPATTGTAIMQIKVVDSEGLEFIRQFYAYVLPINHMPTIAADTLNGTEDTDLTFTAAQLLTNDSDIDGDTLFIENLTDPEHGYIVFDGTEYVYHPDSNYAGEDTFTYRISDVRILQHMRL